MDDKTRVTLRSATAALATALTLTAYYALDRTRAGIFDPGPDPATVSTPGPSEYFWRITICAYLTPLLLAGFYALARGREQRAWNATQRMLIPVVLIAAALSVALP